MSKNASNSRKSKKSTKKAEFSLERQRTLQLAEYVRLNLMSFVIQEGMKAVDEMLEQDREALCGPANKKRAAGSPLRWGATEGRLVMGGERVIVRKPRVRHQGQEMELPSWEQFADEDPLDERALEQMTLGVSTRGYDRSTEDLPEELEAHGASKSAVSRRFVAMTQRKLHEWMSSDLSQLDIAAIMIDGIAFEQHTVLVALGIDTAGKKHPLGVWLGATENARACGELLDNLIERNLDPQRSYLFVIDGSKALRKAIGDRFGTRALVQRCQEHKRRNVRDALPKRLHPTVSKQMRDAYKSKSKKTAKKRLLHLAKQLEADHPDAMASLKEGLDETLTLKDLGLGDALERTLSTTNPIENLNGTIRRVTKRVKRWRDGTMIKRWVGAGIFEAARGFRRLRGYRAMPVLLRALRKHAEQIHSIDPSQEVA